MARRYTKKRTLVRELLGNYNAIKTFAKKVTFAEICDRRILNHKSEILWNQYMIEQIDEIYKDYLDLGKKKLLKKYSGPKRIPKTKLRSDE